MSKRLFILCLLIGLCFFATTDVFAATKARVASFDRGIGEVMGIGDLSSGDTVEVDSDGNLAVVNRENFTDSRQIGDALVYTGAATLQRIIFTPATADDFLLVYDATSKTGTHIVDIQGHTANQTIVVDLGIDIGTGIYVDESRTLDCEYTVVYKADPS